jgi:hypothetical protein
MLLAGLVGFWVVERKGQRREPATRDIRHATRRAGWRPFAGPSSSTEVMGTSGGNEPASQSWYRDPDEKKDPGVWTG